MTFIKLDQADLDSPCRELSNGGLKFVVVLLVCWQINFLSAQTLTLNPAVKSFSALCFLERDKHVVSHCAKNKICHNHPLP